MPKQPNFSVPTALVKALEHNLTAKVTVEQSGDELLMINTVLKQEIPGHVQTGDVAQALEKIAALESKIHHSAEELAQVHHLLSKEISERFELEQELAKTKTALVLANDALNSTSRRAN